MNLEIKLSKQTEENLLKIGYKKLTSIQKKAIPLVLEGKDVIGKSQTGTGKTAAFIIPVLEKLTAISEPQVLVLVPTRELALQVSEETKKLSQHTDLQSLAIIGGEDIERQLKKLRDEGADIIVGTPGRIIDHLNQKGKRKALQFDKLKVLVLDEADEMIRRGFLEEIEKIIKQLPKERQTLLFSATTSPQIVNFSGTYLKNPVHIIAEKKTLNEGVIEQYYLETPSFQKESALISFLHFNKPDLTIIFANTKRKVDELKESLIREKFFVSHIHGDLSQSQRIKALSQFQNRKDRNGILIATGVARRGLDIPEISLVINYDIPNPEEYIHQIGRTGRAGASGKAVTFVSSPKEKWQLMNIIKQTGSKIEPFVLPSKEEIYQKKNDELIEEINNFIETKREEIKENKGLNDLTEKHGVKNVLNASLFLLLEPKIKFLREQQSQPKPKKIESSYQRNINRKSG